MKLAIPKCIIIIFLRTMLSLTLCDPLDYSLSSSSVLGFFEARMLEGVAICFPMGSSQPRDRTHISYIAGGFFSTEFQKFPIVMKSYYYLTVFILLDL